MQVIMHKDAGLKSQVHCLPTDAYTTNATVAVRIRYGLERK